MSLHLITTDQHPTMSSREIAELTGKEIGHIHRDIRSLLEQLSDDPEVDHVRQDKDARGFTSCFHLPKGLSITLVAGYNARLRKAIIDRWQELEAQAADPMRFLNDPQVLRGLLLGSTEKVMELEGQVKQLAPKAAALSRLTEGSDGSFCLTDAAKDLQTKPREFFKKLQEMGWIYRRPGTSGWIAYQHRITQGVLEHKVAVGEKSDGSEWLSTQVRVTARGMAKLSEIFVREAA